MKTILVAVTLALVTVSASAAIQYEFVQKNTTNDSVEPVTELSARAIVDGESSRIDFVGGTIYPPGTYVVSTDGSRRLFFVDPTNKWYTEVNTSTFASALGASTIKISNVQKKLETLQDRPIIAGQPTEHTRLVLTYDISVTIRSIPLRQHVRTEIDTWSTPKFTNAGASAFTSALRTGNPEIDNVLEAETTRMPGFPMRQIVTTRTTPDLPAGRSELQVPRTKTIVREMWVTSIRETNALASAFTVPASYRRAEEPAGPTTAAEILTFEPGTK